MPDFKTIADFRRDNGPAIRASCRRFVMLCRRLNLFSEAAVAIDGSKFKAVNARDKNYTPAAIQRRIEQVETPSVAICQRWTPPTGRGRGRRPNRASQGAARPPWEQMQHLREMEAAVKAAPDGQISLTDPDASAMATSGKGTGMVGYNVQTAVDSSTT